MTAQSNPQHPAENNIRVLTNTFIEPPYSQEAEASLLGAVLINPDIYQSIALFLDPDDFYILRHKYIWQAFARLTSKKEPIDIMTLADELSKMGWLNDIGEAYLTHLLNVTPTSLHGTFYAQLVKRCAVRRYGMQIFDECKGMLMNEELSLTDILPALHSKVLSIMGKMPNNTSVSMRDAAALYEAFLNNPATLATAKSGLLDLDRITGDFKPGLNLIGGETGVGKSVLLQCIALFNGLQGTAVQYFSTEMDELETFARFIRNMTGYSMDEIRRGEVKAEDIQSIRETIQTLKRLKITIDRDKSRVLTPQHVRARATEAVGNGAKLVIVDHLHDMSISITANPFRNDRNAELAEIARQLRDTSQELNVPFLVAGQLNRKGSGTKPTIFDFRDCGRLEQLARCIVLIYWPYKNDKMKPPNNAELIVGKNRQDGRDSQYRDSADVYYDFARVRFLNAATRIVNLGDL